MRILVIVSPFVAYPLAYKICKEMQGVHGAGKRKTPNVVSRTDQGEYVATPTPVYTEDAHQELAPTPVPAYIEVTPDDPERKRRAHRRALSRRAGDGDVRGRRGSPHARADA